MRFPHCYRVVHTRSGFAHILCSPKANLPRMEYIAFGLGLVLQIRSHLFCTMPYRGPAEHHTLCCALEYHQLRILSPFRDRLPKNPRLSGPTSSEIAHYCERSIKLHNHHSTCSPNAVNRKQTQKTSKSSVTQFPSLSGTRTLRCLALRTTRLTVTSSFRVLS